MLATATTSTTVLSSPEHHPHPCIHISFVAASHPLTRMSAATTLTHLFSFVAASYPLAPSQAVAKLGWKAPTLIQRHTIREALAGRDVLARARTGSGKTAAYALPMLHQILRDKAREGGRRVTVGLVLVPTKELSRQTGRTLREIARFCARDIAIADVSGGKQLKAQRAALKDRPDVVVGTPAQVRAHVDSGAVDLSASLRTLVIDEADLVFSYG